jgi:hypothetical protein
MQQVLPLGVQDREESDLGAKMLGIARDGEQRFGGGAEEHAVDFARVVVRDAGNLFRQREDNVKVLDRKKFGFAVFEPAGALRVLTLRAMPVPARVICVAGVSAMAAFFSMATQGRGTRQTSIARMTRSCRRGKECAWRYCAPCC